MKHSPGFLKLVESVKKRIRETDVHDVQRRLEAGERFYLVDVREESEWSRGHLPGAIHLSKGIIERDIEKTIANPSARLCSIAAGDSAPPSSPTIYSKWVTVTSAPWTAAGEGGARRAIPSRTETGYCGSPRGYA